MTSVSPYAKQNEAPRQQAVWGCTISKAWRWCCVTVCHLLLRSSNHKALSNGLRCCSSCLELTAALWLAWGFPAEPAAEPFSGPGLQVQGEAPGIDPGNSACWSGVLLLLLAPPTTVICWAFAWPKWWLGSLPNLSVGSVPTNASAAPFPGFCVVVCKFHHIWRWAGKLFLAACFPQLFLTKFLTFSLVKDS
jgi:hypothetical protein